MRKKYFYNIFLFLGISASLGAVTYISRHLDFFSTKEIENKNKPDTTEEHPNLSGKLLTPSSAAVISQKGFWAEFPEGSVSKALRVSVSALNKRNLPALGSNIINLTKNAEGYRMRPGGILFEKEISIEIAYDKTKIPEGYTEKDISIFFYDRAKKLWQKLPQSEVKSHLAESVSGKTKESSDFIAGIIKLPESPDTSGFTPTSISGLKAASPFVGVQSVSPPSASPDGSASTSFSIDLPAGRAGMQPGLSIQYSSDGGQSWLGTGWNLTLPSLSIDTRWGAPRYDAQYETESYILSGEELLPNTHRNEWENRTTNKRFYPRREGGFNQIIRKGNHPNNYHWMVKSKSGVTFYYGGDENSIAASSVLADPQGNIGHWAISSQKDLKGNSIHYEYVKDGGVLYPKSIYYTGKNNTKGAYSVHFITDKDLGENLRNDVQISARLGFKQQHNRLLRKIEIKYSGQMVRSYELVYREGAFKKTLLKEIRSYDAEGQLFYTNKMDYYDDVHDSNGNYIPFGAFKTWQVPSDNIAYTILGIDGFSGKPTLVGTSNSESGGVNFRVGVGITGIGRFNNSTLGGGGGSNWGSTHSKVLFQDIDGDNLPDKIYIDGSSVYYRKNLTALGTEGFGPKIPINLSSLGRTKSNSYNYGVDLMINLNNKAGFPIGYNKQVSKNITESYFMDFNGDGLVDFANRGTIYYNRLVNGIPTFSPSSTGTPSPILNTGTLSISGTTGITREELERNNPLHDVVRTWKAPVAGRISISHTYKLIEDLSPKRAEYTKNDGTPKADGVKLYFQHKGNLVWQEDITADDYALKSKTEELNVQKGDVLYFRVSSKEDGNYDKTFWKPEITYTSLAAAQDENSLDLKKYTIEDILFSSEQMYAFPSDTRPTLRGNFVKGATTDGIKLKFYKIDLTHGSKTLVHEQYFSEAAATYDLSLIPLGSFQQAEALKVEIESETEINWRNIDFRPSIEYIDGEGRRVSHPINADFKIYEKLDNFYTPRYMMPSQKGKLRIHLYSATPPTSPTPTPAPGTPPTSGDILLTAKQEGKVVARKRYKVVNGILSLNPKPSDIVSDSVVLGKEVFIEANVSNKKMKEFLDDHHFEIKAQIKDSIRLAKTDPRYTPTHRHHIATSIQQHRDYGVYIPFEEPHSEVKFGKAFRGWGSFVLNGTKASSTIDQSLLVENYGNYDSSNPPNVDPSQHDGSIARPEMEASNHYFIRTKGNTPISRFTGLEDDIYISREEFSPSRLGENDIIQYLDTSLPVLSGGSGRALNMVNEGRSEVFSIGANFGGGSVGIGGSRGSGDTYIKETMADFNGDRFPDFVRGGFVQYTTPRGGISAQAAEIGNFTHSKTSNQGGSINGTYAHPLAKSSASKNTEKSTQQQQNTATQGTQDADKAKATLGLSGGISSGEDHAEHTYTDINGDGLADRVTSSYVSYNTGYGFWSPEPWNFGELNKGESTDTSGGPSLGFSRQSGSFTGGYSYGKSITDMKTQLLDMTGDGLADKVIYQDHGTLVYPNLGNRWDTTPLFIPRTAGRPVGRNVSISHGGGVNISITPPPILFIRLSFTGGGSYGTNTNRVEATFLDVDGDGNLDYVLSEDENDLRVAYSNIRRTNMLKRVETATGSWFEIDYERKMPTYENPNSQWVLKEVKVFDGYTGDGEDYAISRFEYNKPYYDRRERSFYGYGEVKQMQINPQDGTVLRTSVQEYYNEDFFRKSQLKKSTTFDKNGAKLSESSVTYHIADAQSGAVIPSNQLSLPQMDTKSVFIAPKEERERVYEQSDYLEKKTEKHYDQVGNIVKYIDHGAGKPSDKIEADIRYYESATPYFGGIAQSIIVKDANGEVRKREADIHPQTAEVIKIRQFSGVGIYTETQLSYDEYGNLVQVTGAENEKGQRSQLSYQYNPETHSHITKIKDHFGYENTMEYDYRFGALVKTTDRNGESMLYTLDAKGRTISILGPKEAKAGKPYTIRYEYPNLNQSRPAGQLPYALTRNYDPEHNRDIETYTYADGLGRAVQVKKTASIFRGRGLADEEKHIISGKQIYDALGRVVETYYPFTASVQNQLVPAPSSSIPPTKTLYDEKDRPVEQILPDGSSVKTAYKITHHKGENTLHTTQTDALNRQSHTYTDAQGRVLTQVQPDGTETHFEYSAIGELTKVTDAQGHQTLSEYDLLGRRTKLVHPDAGTTILVYDKAGNLIKRQTSQIRGEMPDGYITYHYDYNRLQEIKYPKYPENSVRYHYGAQSEQAGRRGRLWLVEDASGGTEYFYGDMGEVTKEIRSLRIKPVEVQTYVTQYEYDSWNRIQKLVYPDGERLDFGYNIAGNLTSLKGYKAPEGTAPSEEHAYTYLKQQGYDEFEQKVYRLYGNDTETRYHYDPVMRRLKQLKAESLAPAGGGGNFLIQNNRYAYDLVGNILKVENQLPIIRNALGGASSYEYQYDNLNRLTLAKGNYTGELTSASYELKMSYNNLNSITKKELNHLSGGMQKGYTLDYSYNNPAHPHAPSEIMEMGKPKARTYQYDGNGNPVYYEESKSFRSMVWDEENRLRGINDNGKLHLYTYDHTGERAVKSSGESSTVVTNGLTSAVITHMDDYTAYVNPYFVVQKGKFTKHYFEGSARIVSKLGEGTFVHKNTGIMAGGIDYIRQNAQMQEARDNYIRGLKVPPGPPTQHGIYASPEWTGQPYPSLGWQNIRQDQEPPEGWPRPPKFNEPGDVPGPPVQYGDPITPQTVKAGYGFVDNGIREKNLYFYHPDHLGSSSYITDREGRITQHTEYIAFGEVLFEEHSTSKTMPYLFNGKELDQETNLTYFGARYLDMKTSLWLNTDPLSGYNPIQETEHYIDGQHNGGVFNPMNLNTYGYTYQNPILYIDPNGKQSKFWTRFWGGAQMLGGAVEVVGSGVGEYFSGGTATPLMVPLFLNGVDNFQAGARQLWTGETTNTLLHTGTKAGAEALGASEQNAERIATAVDISTIFLGGTNGIKNIKNIFNTKTLTNFEEIAAKGGIANATFGKNRNTIAGWKVVREGGSEKAMKVYKSLLKSGYKSEELSSGGYKLIKGEEQIIFRSSNSGSYKNLDTFTKKINGKQIDVYFKEK